MSPSDLKWKHQNCVFIINRCDDSKFRFMPSLSIRNILLNYTNLKSHKKIRRRPSARLLENGGIQRHHRIVGAGAYPSCYTHSVSSNSLGALLHGTSFDFTIRYRTNRTPTIPLSYYYSHGMALPLRWS